MPRILVADDHQDIRRLIQLLIEREGWEVLLAEEGRSALEMAQQEMPDLIILDIMMPLMDGMEVLRQLGYKRATAKIPVIMLTAKHDVDEVSKAREMGVKDYIGKPINPQRLITAVRRALRLPAPAAAPAR